MFFREILFLGMIYLIYKLASLWWKKFVEYALSNKDTSFSFGLFNVHFIKSKEVAKLVLIDRQTELSYLNDVFNRAHGLTKTISNFKKTDKEWKTLHQALAHSVNEIAKRDDFKGLFHEAFNEHMVEGKYTEITDRVNNFVAEFWSNLMFGPNCRKKFFEIHAELLSILNYTFYTNPYAHIPIIGSLVSYWRRMFVKNDIDRLRLKVILFATSQVRDCDADNCFYKIFENQIWTSDMKDKSKIVWDNMLMSFLVYDFITGLIKGLIIDLAHQDNTSQMVSELNKRIKQPLNDNYIKEILNQNFLFPVRSRVYYGVTRSIGNIKLSKWDICLIDLLSSGYQFSFGPRMCVGYVMVNKILKELLEKLNLYYIIDTSNNPVKRSSNPNIPNIDSIHDIRLVHKLTVQNGTYIRDDPDTKIPIMDTNYYYYQPTLLKFFTNDIAKIVKANGVNCLIGIATRGLGLAGAAAYTTGLPLKNIYKKGKLKNNVITHTNPYRVGNKNHEEILEIASEPKYSSRCSEKILIIDDGYASGGTTIACTEMLRRMGHEVYGIYVMHRHTYCKAMYSYGVKLYVGMERL